MSEFLDKDFEANISICLLSSAETAAASWSDACGLSQHLHQRQLRPEAAALAPGGWSH